MNEKNLRPQDLDRLGQAVLTLAGELWVLKDRQRVLEAALAEAGITATDLVDTFQPDAELSKQLEAERATFINQLLNTLAK